MSKKNNDYFELMKKHTACCVEASNLLEDILCKYKADEIGTYREQMHKIEHMADKVQHDILNKLAVEFITVIDQEDILRLVQIIDDIADALDDVILNMYMYHIDNIPESTISLSKVVNRCVKEMHGAVSELKNYKKRESIHDLIVKVNDIESEADRVYQEAIYKLFGSEVSGKTLLGTKAIYDGLEGCCDLCEKVADVIEQVIIKNT